MRLHQGRLQKGEKRPKIYSKSLLLKRKRKQESVHTDRLILWEKPKRKPQDIVQRRF
jgi:hypothetical protein